MYSCFDYCDRFIDRLADAGYFVLYPEETAKLKELVTACQNGADPDQLITFLCEYLEYL